MIQFFKSTFTEIHLQLLNSLFNIATYYDLNCEKERSIANMY